MCVLSSCPLSFESQNGNKQRHSFRNSTTNNSNYATTFNYDFVLLTAETHGRSVVAVIA